MLALGEALPTCPGRWVAGAQYHILSYLGPSWCAGPAPRFPNDLVAGYTEHVALHDGVVTWDVPIDAGGRIPDAFMRQLGVLAERMAAPSWGVVEFGTNAEARSLGSE